VATYRCPLCKSILTADRYHEVLGLYEARKDAEKQLRQRLATQKADERKRRAKLREEKARAVQAAKSTVETKVKIAVASQRKQIEQLRRQNEALRKGQSLADVGLKTEASIARALEGEFKGDDVEHTGKGGDVLHHVIHNKKPVGVIVYEVKDTQKLEAAHIRQANDARRQRKADFAVLVTNGARRNFTGFAIEDGVVIVRPLALLAAAQFLRNYLVEVFVAQLRGEQRSVAGQKLLEYLAGSDFKHVMTTYMESYKNLHGGLEKEIHAHLKQWRERDAEHRRLFTATALLDGSIRALLEGKPALKHVDVKPIALTVLSKQL